MENKLFVASLSFKIRDAELVEIFAAVGNVLSAKVILDRDGRSKGFGFVEMASKEEADQAIIKLNGSNQYGRDIVVNKQKPKDATPRYN
ncbi:MAG: RNA-binding protein [Proteobacteria bacterium]|jgi:cold-inducible RNA-binding protein|nr:RNA-binding protein [Pseudomonadota bacterium]